MPHMRWTPVASSWFRLFGSADWCRESDASSVDAGRDGLRGASSVETLCGDSDEASLGDVKTCTHHGQVEDSCFTIILYDDLHGNQILH